MNKSIFESMPIVYCEHCKKEFPISKGYANRRINAGLSMLCYSCEWVKGKEGEK